MQNHWKGIGRYSTIGLELALSPIIGLLAGHWLDDKLATGYWLTLAGFLFGVAAGFRTLFGALTRANRDAERSDQEEREERDKFHDDQR